LAGRDWSPEVGKAAFIPGKGLRKDSAPPSSLPVDFGMVNQPVFVAIILSSLAREEYNTAQAQFHATSNGFNEEIAANIKRTFVAAGWRPPAPRRG